MKPKLHQIKKNIELKMSLSKILLHVACRVRVTYYFKDENHQFWLVILNKLSKHVFNITSKLNNHT